MGLLDPNGATVSLQDEQKKKRDEVSAIDGTPQATTMDRLAHVEQSSGATLPTSVSLALADSKLRQEQLSRASSLLARRWDVAPEWLFHRVGTERLPEGLPMPIYRDPSTGGLLTLETARRIIKPFEPRIIAGMLQRIAPQTTEPDTLHVNPEMIPKLRHFVTEPKVSAATIAEVMRSFGPLPGHALTFDAAVGAAVQVARSHVDVKLFGANLRQLAGVAGLDPLQAISAAHIAAVNGVEFSSVGDAARFVTPPEGLQAISAAERRTADVMQTARNDAGQAAGYGLDLSNPDDRAEYQRRLRLNMGNAVSRVRTELGVDPMAALGRSLLHSITGTHEDYLQTAHRVVQEMRLQQSTFQNSVLGKVFGGVMKGFDYAWRPFEAGGLLVFQSLTPPGLRHFKPGFQDQLDVLHGRTSFGQRLLVDEWHLPHWTAQVGDLALGFAIAPDVIAGRFLAERNALRTLSEVVRTRGPSAWQDIADEFLTKPHRFLTKGDTMPGFIARSVWDSKSAEDFYLNLDRVNVGRFGAAGLHPTTAAQLWFYGKELQAAGRPLAQFEGDVRTVLAHAFGARVPVGSLAARVDEETQNLTRIYQDLLDPSEMARFGTAVPDVAKTIEETRQIIGRLSEFDTGVLTGRLPLALELPHYSPLRSLTLGARETLADAPGFRGLRKLINHPPDNMIVWDVPASDPVGYLRRWAVASGKFRQGEIDAHSLSLGQLLASDQAGRELKITAFLEARNREMIQRVATDYGLTSDQADTILNGVNGASRRQLFGVRPSISEAELAGMSAQDYVNFIGHTAETVPLEVLRKPVFETQLANQWTMIDPIHARYAMGNAVGIFRTFRSRLLRAIGVQVGSELPRLKLAGLSLSGFLRQFEHDLTRGLFLSWWKPLVVLRPAYLWRVPLGDENLRFLATAGVLGRFESTEHGAKFLDWLGEKRGAAPETMTIKYGANAGETIEFQRPGHIHDETLKALAGTGGFYDLAKFGGDDFHRAIDNIAGKVRRGAGGLNYGLVKADDPGFMDQWLHELQGQIGLSAHGQLMLSDIAAGKSESEMIQHATAFLEGQGRHIADRLLGPGWSKERLDLLVRQAVGMTRYYTGAAAGFEGAGRIALAARDNSLTRDLLQGIPTKARPSEIHGFDTAMAFSSNNIIKRGVDRLYSAILQTPTNVFNRHPFAKLWRDRSERAMLKVLNDSGVPITAELRRNIAIQANAFAITQVRRVLFDFRDTARYMDMVGFAAPFFQPFTEAFISWGRIIRNNPAVLGYARLAAQAMTQSGFIRHDPHTGELVIPMSNFLGSVPLLSAVTGVKGWQISNGLSSWNLFLNSTFPAPFPGVTGGFPIPTPGLSPPALLLLQRFIEGGLPFQHGHTGLTPAMRAKLSSWAFQFGPEQFPSALLPSWMNSAISAAYPKWMEAETNSQVSEFLRIQEMLGMNVTPDQPPAGVSAEQWANMTPGRRQQVWEQYRVKLARSQSQGFSGMKALFSLVFPGSPRYTYPTADLEDEFRRLSDRLGYSKARDEFLRRHPDLWSITIPKTMWGRQNDSPVPIPSNQFVEQILRNPQVREFAQRDPAMVWALIPRELREQGKLDIGSFFAQIARGDRVSLSPEQFLKSEEIQKGWEAYFIHYNAWVAWQDAHPHLNAGDSRYDFRKSQYDESVNHVALIYPTWYSGSPDLGQDGYQGFQQQRVDPNVMRMSRFLAGDSLFQKTDAGKGLAAYLKLRDSVAGEMRGKNITSIDTKLAGELGLTKRFNDGIAEIEKAHPDFAIARGIFFRYDLHGLPAFRERLLGKMEPAQRQEFFTNEETWKQLRGAPFKAAGLGRDQAWIDLRQFTDRMFSDYPADQNPILVNWKNMRPDERNVYRTSLSARPYVFWSRFDRETVAGEKTNSQTEAIWTALSRAYMEISQRKDAHPNIHTSGLYDAVDRQVRAFMQSDPTFAAQVQHSNDWTWRFQTLAPELSNQHNPGRIYWSAFLDAVRKVQVIADEKKLHGEKEWVPAKRAYYFRLEHTLSAYAQSLADVSPDFRRQWNDLEAKNGLNDLLNDFVPKDWYFPLGGFRVSPRG